MPTSLWRSRMVWVATSPMCATNFSLRLPASLQPEHGQRLVVTFWRSRWKARCMAMAAWRISVIVVSGSPSAWRERKAASPSISMRSKPGAASIILSSIRAVLTSACARLIRCVLMYSV